VKGVTADTLRYFTESGSFGGRSGLHHHRWSYTHIPILRVSATKCRA